MGEDATAYFADEADAAVPAENGETTDVVDEKPREEETRTSLTLRDLIVSSPKKQQNLSELLVSCPDAESTSVKDVQGDCRGYDIYFTEFSVSIRQLSEITNFFSKLRSLYRTEVHQSVVSSNLLLLE
jgi:hypothetical protein